MGLFRVDRAQGETEVQACNNRREKPGELRDTLEHAFSLEISISMTRTPSILHAAHHTPSQHAPILWPPYHRSHQTIYFLFLFIEGGLRLSSTLRGDAKAEVGVGAES